SGEGVTLNNISQIYEARGYYDTAVDYLRKSLAIRQDIGDGAGMCIGLINMGAILFKQGKQEDGLASMTQGYVIAKQIGSAQALKGLESLGKQLGGNGLAFWEERLAARS
ncbi:MAG: tetratricopeptide repeat protein, partial [Gammaproteobacteria bacterium]|nr:tetratricopeptide repeat protein [Gammaproteobacteria bacterium]